MNETKKVNDKDIFNINIIQNGVIIESRSTNLEGHITKLTHENVYNTELIKFLVAENNKIRKELKDKQSKCVQLIAALIEKKINDNNTSLDKRVDSFIEKHYESSLKLIINDSKIDSASFDKKIKTCQRKMNSEFKKLNDNDKKINEKVQVLDNNLKGLNVFTSSVIFNKERKINERIEILDTHIKNLHSKLNNIEETLKNVSFNNVKQNIKDTARISSLEKNLENINMKLDYIMQNNYMIRY